MDHLPGLGADVMKEAEVDSEVQRNITANTTKIRV